MIRALSNLLLLIWKGGKKPTLPPSNNFQYILLSVPFFFGDFEDVKIICSHHNQTVKSDLPTELTNSALWEKDTNLSNNGRKKYHIKQWCKSLIGNKLPKLILQGVRDFFFF